MSRVPGIRGRSLGELLAPQGRRRQPLPGFDRGFADIPDYIVRVTHRIWDERMLGEIRRYYAPDCPVWTLGGPVAGAEAVIDGTIATLAEFPDRTMVPEAVIWSGNGRDGYLSSHRIRSEATHRGHGAFGPPTGRRIIFRTIADCLCRRNRIVEEWLARDTGGMARGLGLDPLALAAARPADAALRAWWARMRDGLRAGAPGRARPGRARPGRDWRFAEGLLGAGLLGRGRVAALYRPDAVANMAGGETLAGRERIAGWWQALAGLLGEPVLRLDQVAANPVSADPAAGREVAARWWLAARHAGSGRWGPATGAEILLMGISHWLVTADGVAEETSLFDEIAVLRQLPRA